MALKMRFEYRSGQTKEVMSFQFSRFPKAVWRAVHEVGLKGQAAGRKSIKAAGGRFSSGNFANSLRIKFYPDNPDAVKDHAASYLYSNAFYANIFEEGGTIRGKPMMWLPLTGVPKRFGNRRTTPELFEKNVGPLQLIRRPGKLPLLVAPVEKGKRGGAKKRSAKSLKAGAASGGINVPVFVGIPLASIKKRFAVKQAVADAQKELPALFRKYLFEV